MKDRSTWKKVLSWGALGLMALAWLAFLRPAFLGGSADYVMVSGHSMEPKLHTGDLVIVNKESEYSEGEVIAYEIPAGQAGAGSMVIHRIIGGNGTEGYMTQGDNRDEPDMWRPTNAEVHGRWQFLVPKAGRVITLLRSPFGMAALAAIAVFMLIVFDGKKDEKTATDEVAAS